MKKHGHDRKLGLKLETLAPLQSHILAGVRGGELDPNSKASPSNVITCLNHPNEASQTCRPQ